MLPCRRRNSQLCHRHLRQRKCRTAITAHVASGAERLIFRRTTPTPSWTNSSESGLAGSRAINASADLQSPFSPPTSVPRESARTAASRKLTNGQRHCDEGLLICGLTLYFGPVDEITGGQLILCRLCQLTLWPAFSKLVSRHQHARRSRSNTVSSWSAGTSAPELKHRSIHRPPTERPEQQLGRSNGGSADEKNSS